MSEQTPNSSGDLNGSEPSMEDILASIRKIISDDEPVAMESPEDIVAVNVVDTPTPDGLDDLMQGIHMDSSDLTSDAVLDAAVIQPAPMPDMNEIVDLNIDDVLAGLEGDTFASDVAAATAMDIPVIDNAQDDTLSSIIEDFQPTPVRVEAQHPIEAIIESDGIVPDTEDDILAFLDNDIPLADAAPLEAAQSIPAALGTTAAMSILSKTDDTVGVDDEMDALLDDILLSPADNQAENLTSAAPIGAASAAEDSDLELVKSLMADLADDPDGFETEEDLDALLAIPEVEETPENKEVAVQAEAVEAEGEGDDFFDNLMAEPELEAEPEIQAEPEPEIQAAAEIEPEIEAFAEIHSIEDPAAADLSAVDAAEPEDDILGDILDMTLEDELDSHPEDLTSLDDILAAEQDNIAENLDIAADDFEADDYDIGDLPSLSEIAAAAEADAVAAEMVTAPPAVAATAGLAAIVGGAALGTTALGAAPAEVETETAETYSEPTPAHSNEITHNQETSMPVQAVQTDAILDEVTETATAGAFAELNQVVEDKAIFSERGPRIGDLVQEALRPMLKEWLDANLKGIVERAVAKEVKRISTGK